MFVHPPEVVSCLSIKHHWQFQYIQLLSLISFKRQDAPSPKPPRLGSFLPPNIRFSPNTSIREHQGFLRPKFPKPKFRRDTRASSGFSSWLCWSWLPPYFHAAILVQQESVSSVSIRELGFSCAEGSSNIINNVGYPRALVAAPPNLIRSSSASDHNNPVVWRVSNPLNISWCSQQICLA